MSFSGPPKRTIVQTLYTAYAVARPEVKMPAFDKAGAEALKPFEAQADAIITLLTTAAMT